MHIRTQAGGREILVTSKAGRWTVEAGAATASGRYLDDVLTRTLPALPQRGRERLVVDLLEWRNERLVRLHEPSGVRAEARRTRARAQGIRRHSEELEAQTHALAQQTARLRAELSRSRG